MNVYRAIQKMGKMKTIEYVLKINTERCKKNYLQGDQKHFNSKILEIIMVSLTVILRNMYRATQKIYIV